MTINNHIRILFILNAVQKERRKEKKTIVSLQLLYLEEIKRYR